MKNFTNGLHHSPSHVNSKNIIIFGVGDNKIYFSVSLQSKYVQRGSSMELIKFLEGLDIHMYMFYLFKMRTKKNCP